MTNYEHCPKCGSVDLKTLQIDTWNNIIKLKCNTCGYEFNISLPLDLSPVTEQIQEQDSFPNPFIGHQHQY